MSFGCRGMWIVGALLASATALAQSNVAPPVRLPPVGVDRPLREIIDPSWACVESLGPAQVALPAINRGPGLAQTPVIPELAGASAAGLAAPPAPQGITTPQGIMQVAYLNSAAPTPAAQPTVRLAQMPETGPAQGPPTLDAVPNYSIDPRATTLQSGRPLSAPDLEEFDYPLEHARAITGIFDNTLFMVRAGIEDPIGGGFFGNRLDTGWGIQLGARRTWFGQSERTGAWFGELFGSFGETGGSGPAEITPGAVSDITPGRTELIQVADGFETQLRDLKRAQLNFGIGRYFAPRWGRVPGRTWQFMTHGGAQFGHAHASFLNRNTATIDAIVADRIANGSDPLSLEVLYSFDNTDTYFGLYFGGGVALNWYNVSSWWGRWRQISLGVEVDYVNQWIDLDGFSSPDASPLSTLTPMGTFTIGY